MPCRYRSSAKAVPLPCFQGSAGSMVRSASSPARRARDSRVCWSWVKTGSEARARRIRSDPSRSSTVRRRADGRRAGEGDGDASEEAAVSLLVLMVSPESLPSGEHLVSGNAERGKRCRRARRVVAALEQIESAGRLHEPVLVAGERLLGVASLAAGERTAADQEILCIPMRNLERIDILSVRYVSLHGLARGHAGVTRDDVGEGSELPILALLYCGHGEAQLLEPGNEDVTLENRAVHVAMAEGAQHESAERRAPSYLPVRA